MGGRGDGKPAGAGATTPPVPPYPRPAFGLDALWNIVSLDLANYADAFAEIAVDTHFFDVLSAFPRSLPRTARAELHTAEYEIVRALTYFEHLAPQRTDAERARHSALIDVLSKRLRADGKLRRLGVLRQEARTGLQRLRDRYTTLTFAAPVRVCTLSVRSPFDRMLILRFYCTLQAVPDAPVDPDGAGPGPQWRVTLLPQNDLTEEVLGLIDH